MTSIQIDRTDGLSSSVAIKGPCRVATTANVTLSGEQTIDGVAVVTDDRVLVKDQTTASENGIYVVDTGAWRRAKDFSRTNDVKSGTQVFVVSGTAHASTQFMLATAGDIVVGTTSLVFEQSSIGYNELSNMTVLAETRTALKAIDTSQQTVAFLKEAAREGVFVFRAGDYSTQITTDAAEGVYIEADDTAATAGAWVREADYAQYGYNLDWFGRVDGNTTAGVTANNAAMTSAIAVANLVGGGTVVVPVGRTRLDPFTVSVNVWLRGAVQGPWTAGGNPMDYGYAPILLVNSIASNFITLAPSNTGQVSGQISDLFIWYPDSGASPVQNFPTSATPINTLYAVDGPNSGKGGYRVNRCTFGNAYGGVKIQQGRSVVNNNVFGCFLVGLYVDKCRDWVVHNDNMHQVFWDTFNGLTYPQTIDAWVKSNSIGVDIYSADSFEINGLKLFSRYIGMRFLDSSDVSQSPRNSYGRITNVDLDSVAYGVHCRSVNNNGGGVKITNMDIGGYAVVGTAVQASILSDAGGTEAGLLQWIGGSVRGSFATGATTIAMSAGKVLAKYVHGLTPYGVMGPPAVPATTVAFTNPYPFVCEVHVNGGTVTAIAINGGTTGKTSGTFQVAVGKTITLTYTVAPTWTWFGT